MADNAILFALEWSNPNCMRNIPRRPSNVVRLELRMSDDLHPALFQLLIANTPMTKESHPVFLPDRWSVWCWFLRCRENYLCPFPAIERRTWDCEPQQWPTEGQKWTLFVPFLHEVGEQALCDQRSLWHPLFCVDDGDFVGLASCLIFGLYIDITDVSLCWEQRAKVQRKKTRGMCMSFPKEIQRCNRLSRTKFKKNAFLTRARQVVIIFLKFSLSTTSTLTTRAEYDDDVTTTWHHDTTNLQISIR